MFTCLHSFTSVNELGGILEIKLVSPEDCDILLSGLEIDNSVLDLEEYEVVTSCTKSCLSLMKGTILFLESFSVKSSNFGVSLTFFKLVLSWLTSILLILS